MTESSTKANLGVLTGRRETDFIAGSSPLQFQPRNPSGDWSAYLPVGEKQFDDRVDFMACVSFSAINSIETQLFFLTGKKFNFSDRFIAKLSDTTRQGNYQYKVADAIRKYGLVPEELWPTTSQMTWEEYYADIPQSVIDEGKKFLQQFAVAYEFVPLDQGALHMQHAPLQAIIVKENPYHAVLSVTLPQYFDSYEPYLKPFTTIYDYLKLVVTEKLMNQAKVVLGKDGTTVYICYPQTQMNVLIDNCTTEGIVLPNPIPNADSL